MEFLRRVGDFASATGRATEPGRRGPCDAGPTMLGQLCRIGPGTTGRCMGFLRWVGDFASTAHRVTEPARCHRRDAATMLGQLYCIGTGTAGRYMGFLR
jgi:hypothetical protein